MLQAGVMELMGNCPFHQANPEDCPLHAVRELPPRQRSQWINRLTEADLDYLTAYHHICLKIKQQAAA